MTKKLLKKIDWKIMITAFLLLSLFTFAFTVHACGCGVLINHRSSTEWSYGKDSAEKSFINYQNGIEKLIISLDISSSSQDSFLVVPVPGRAREVQADILSDTPKMILDYNVGEKTRDNLQLVKSQLLATQIYTIPFLGLGESSAPSGGGELGLGGAVGSTPGSKPAVTVYEHLEKSGMTAEVLSAETPDALYDYLSAKGLTIAKNSIPIFQDYINKNFTFVAAWISSPAKDVSARGIAMSFPTPEMFYPLKPGSVYQGEGTTKEIYVIGQVTPKLYGELTGLTQVDYYYHTAGEFFGNAGANDSQEQINKFFAPYGESDKFGFTLVKFNARPEAYKADLYFSESTPLKVLFEDFLADHPLIIFLILLFLVPLPSVYLSIKIFRLKMSRRQFIRLWILSWFTIIGTVVGSHFLPSKKIKFVAIYSIIFLILSALTTSSISGIF